MIKVVFIGAIVIFCHGCAVERNDYSYGYYTGIKNPRVKRDPVAKPPAARPQDPKPTTRRVPDYHHVHKGETLYSIAWQYGHDVREVANWNHIRPPYTIYPNDRIRVTRPTSTTGAYRTPSQAPAQKTVRKYTKRHTNTAKKNTKTTRNTVKISWQWPTKGKIIGKYSARDTGKKGVDIAGKAGQRVYAAAAGDIVYSGSGLRGYGKLIIIKHNDTYLSAYAHNKRLHVKEDQTVKKGQHIADMGSSEANRPMLHFEVRRNGKPVDPLRYLPRRR